MLRSRLSRIALALAVLTLALALRPGAFRVEAQDEDAITPLLGRYRNVSADGGEAAIEAAVDEALEEANALVRAMARSRILDNNASVHRVVIAQDGDAVEVTYDETRSYRAPLGGSPVEHRAPDGTDVRVRYAMRGPALLEVVDSGRGRARTTYARDGDRLQMSTTIASPHLPKRVRFELDFRLER
jgi:hypothetical protein